MSTLVLAVVLAGFVILIITDCFRAYLQAQEQRREAHSSQSRLLKELGRYGSD